MDFIQKPAFFLLLIASLIFVHELGHFLVAKLFKVKVLRFSLGFGPRLLGFTWGETEYRISALPLGGYVKMAGDDPTEELEPADRGRGFLEQPPWKRAAIALAGPAMNLAFPVLVYFLAFYVGGQELSSRLGRVVPDGPAYAAGLRSGDRIVAIDGEPVRYFEDLKDRISPKWDREVAITFERLGKVETVKVVPEKIEERNVLETSHRGLIGISPEPYAAVVGVSDPSSPAAKAGLASFDRVVKANGQKIETWPQLEEALALSSGPVALTVVRDVEAGGGAGPLNTWKTLEVTVAADQRGGAGAFGLEPIDAFVFSVEKGSPAHEAGLRRGDKLVSLDGKPIAGFGPVARALQTGPDRPFTLGLVRAGAPSEARVQPKQIEREDDYGNKFPDVAFGAVPDQRATTFADGEMIPFQTTAAAAFARSLRVVPEEVRRTTLAIAKLATLQLSAKSIGGPIMMYDAATRSAEMGFRYFLQMMGFISINLGLMNLLPIPVLDGFHILSASFEAVRRRPLSIRARTIANYVGLAMLLGLMLLALRNDIVNIILN